MNNIIDGNPYFKKANLLTLSNDDLELMYTALYNGAVRETNRYLFKPQDMPIVDKAVDQRVEDEIDRVVNNAHTEPLEGDLVWLPIKR